MNNDYSKMWVDFSLNHTTNNIILCKINRIAIALYKLYKSGFLLVRQILSFCPKSEKITTNKITL